MLVKFKALLAAGFAASILLWASGAAAQDSFNTSPTAGDALAPPPQDMTPSPISMPPMPGQTPAPTTARTATGQAVATVPALPPPPTLEPFGASLFAGAAAEATAGPN